jgi:hypothetical protein
MVMFNSYVKLPEGKWYNGNIIKNVVTKYSDLMSRHHDHG